MKGRKNTKFYTNLKPQGYIPRLVDRQVQEYLELFGAVEICGAKWCGKSWTSAAFSKSITRIDENLSLYEEDPSVALIGKKPHAIDEWQDAPAIWNVLRHHIDDKGNAPGQFILTGSSTPPFDETRHSGAGRIGRLLMRTMTLSEMGESTKKVSLKDLFEGKFQKASSRLGAPSHLGLPELAHIICRGGWPVLQQETRAKQKQESREADSLDILAQQKPLERTASRREESGERIINGYLDALFDIGMKKMGKNPDLSRKIAYSLARNIGTSATLKTIAEDAAQDRTLLPANETIADYLSAFKANYFLEELPGWDAPVKAPSRIRTKPKRYFADPSLAAALLSLNAERLLEEGQIFGNLFEALCVHDVAVYAELLPDAQARPLRYYADADGLEVDIIIELRDGRWGAFEIKLGEAKLDEAASHLLRLQKKIQANPAARNPKPAFLGIIVGKGMFARQRKEDGIFVIPLDTLTA